MRLNVTSLDDLISQMVLRRVHNIYYSYTYVLDEKKKTVEMHILLESELKDWSTLRFVHLVGQAAHNEEGLKELNGKVEQARKEIQETLLDAGIKLFNGWFE